MMKSKYPKNLIDLSSISQTNYPVELWEGAVNFILIENNLILIKRSETMPSHSGQIGLFGGHKLENEKDPITTAKREFEEETGISSSKLNILGLIPATKTSKEKIIIPVVSEFIGTIDDFLAVAESNGEWDNIIFSPIEELAKIERWQHAQSASHPIFFFPLLTDFCRYKDITDTPYLLWGATAKMTLNFFQID